MTPYTTKAGVQIGRLYTPPTPMTDPDQAAIQRALLNERARVDWDGIAIILGCAAALLIVGVML